jgi:hypothetical protein
VPILTLTSDDPTTIKLPRITVPPLATTRVSLKSQLHLACPGLRVKSAHRRAARRWGDGSRPNSLVGAAQLIPVSDPASQQVSNARSFSAWVFTVDATEGLTLVTPFQVPADAINTVLEGLWWLPYPDTQAYFALQNTSRRSINLRMELFGSGSAGTALREETFRLGPAASKLVNIGDMLPASQLPDLGGIRFSYRPEIDDKILPGAVVARGMLIQEQLGFSSSLMTHESLGDIPTDTPTELHAPALYFGDIASLVGGSPALLHPQLLLRNIGKADVTVQGTIYGRDCQGVETSLELQPISLPAQSLTHIDLEEQRRVPVTALSPLPQCELADGVAGLRLAHNNAATDVIAELINVNPEGNVVFYDAVTNLFLGSVPAYVGISFNLEPGSTVKPSHQSFLIVKNVSDEPQEVRILFEYRRNGRTEQYDVMLPDVPAQQTSVVDIKHLRDAQVPDRDGRILPADLLFGGAVIFSRLGALVASNPTFLSALPASPQQGPILLLGPAGGNASGAGSCPAPRLLPCCLEGMKTTAHCRECLVPPDGAGGGIVEKDYPGNPFGESHPCITVLDCEHHPLNLTPGDDVSYKGIKKGDNVYAVDDGRVIGVFVGMECKDKKCDASTVIIYDDRDQRLTVYEHVTSGLIAGVKIVQGDPIGTVDLTGNTTGPHVHISRLQNKNEFETWLSGGTGKDILDLLKKRARDDFTCGFRIPACEGQKLENLVRILGEWPFADP